MTARRAARVREGIEPTSPGAPRRLVLLLDANVVFDVLTGRQPWADEAAQLVSAVEEGRAAGAVAAHTITTLYYLLAKSTGRTSALASIIRLTQLFEIVAVDSSVIAQALASGLRDFEDAVQAVCGLRVAADYVVTRNGRDFVGSGVAVATPAEVLARL